MAITNTQTIASCSETYSILRVIAVCWMWPFNWNWHIGCSQTLEEIQVCSKYHFSLFTIPDNSTICGILDFQKWPWKLTEQGGPRFLISKKNQGAPKSEYAADNNVGSNVEVYQSTTDHNLCQVAQVLERGSDCTQYAICSCDYYSSWQTCSKLKE